MENVIKMSFSNYVLIIFGFMCKVQSGSCEFPHKMPTVGISVLVRNKAHTLPYFFSCIENLDYPKDRMYLWIYSDYNQDNSIEVINTWADQFSSQYKGVFITANASAGPLQGDQEKPTSWTPDRFKHVITLREEALQFARNMWADYIFLLDADVYLTNPQTLKLLVDKNYIVAAPMLVSDGLYSNFWCGMTDNYYYKRTDDYKPILRRQNTGCFTVPMIHSAVLISLREKITDTLTYDPEKAKDYDGPVDDIITFAINAKANGIEMHVCNDHLYGFVQVPLEDSDDLEDDREQLLNVKLEAISRRAPLPLRPALAAHVTFPDRSKFGCDEIYMINLERRTERRALMEMSFKELGMDFKLFKAIDGRDLDMGDLAKHEITLMPGYEDPYHKRPMKAGEVGCFLSHYYIWKEVAAAGHARALVLEDDVRFTPHFRAHLRALLDDLRRLDWDLVYIGRKILSSEEEEWASAHTTSVAYSYWTLGYLVSARGARRLLAARPLARLLPVDEFLPIMFDKHPNDTWKSYFPQRNLKALSAAPLLIYPTHYTGEEGYVSDTEDSPLLASTPSAPPPPAPAPPRRPRTNSDL